LRNIAPGMASGGVLTGPTRILAGEAGREAVVPLERPLSMVDPSVRWLSAIAQGKNPGASSGMTVSSGKQLNVSPGAITMVVPSAMQSRQVASSLLDALIAEAK
jgi:hypothetical protein